MTIEEAKMQFGNPRINYYVSCADCPASKTCDSTIETSDSIVNGYEYCWEVIAKHFSGADEPISDVKPDNVNHPAHYETGKFECIDVMVETQGEEAVKAYCLCAAFKYLYRHNRKNGLEDIKKARWYLDKYVELEEGEADG